MCLTNNHKLTRAHHVMRKKQMYTYSVVKAVAVRANSHCSGLITDLAIIVQFDRGNSFALHGKHTDPWGNSLAPGPQY